MDYRECLNSVSRVDEHIFLSGIIPLEICPDIIADLNIRYILSCIPRENARFVHNELLIRNPHLKILYLPYEDSDSQNLWTRNNDIVTLASSLTDTFQDTILESYRSRPLIEIGYRFINEATKNGDNVLVHCHAGVSRSVSLVVYYLMKKFHAEFNNSMRAVNNARKIANPNDSFKAQLIGYQKMRAKFRVDDAENISRNIVSKKRHLSRLPVER